MVREMDAAIVTDNLTRYYDSLCAVDSMNIEVGNEIFGLLGPNGSGKTTTVLMLTTLLTPTSGTAQVCGTDIVRHPRRVREKISYVPQDMALDIRLTGRENVRLFAELYGIDRPKEKTDEVLGILELADRADEFVKAYSGGMRRRLELAQALVHDPDVLFLDEPTVGLDVAARRKIWDYIRLLKKKGMTVFVTTHYMDEADRNCDRIAFIDHGKIRECDTPKALKSQINGDIIVITTEGEAPDITIPDVQCISRRDDEVTYFATDGQTAGEEITEKLVDLGVIITSVSVRKPTLDDVFLHLVDGKEDTGPMNMTSFRNMLGRR